MAGTYYGYAERNASDEINWSQVGKNLTDMLSKESQIREEKKAAIDKATREYGETLANAPQGEHQGVNQWALTYADSAQQARLMQDRLLKSGQLKQKDYLVMRQNITDGTAQAFNLIKEYQAEYNDKMERYRNGDAQALEQFLMEEAEGFANFNNSELYINPTDFTVNVAKKEKQIVDGKEVYVMSKNPNDFTTVNAMRNRIKGKFDKLDVDKTLQAGVNVLGKDVNSLVELASSTSRGGLIKSVNDITQRKDFGVEANEAVSLFERSESTYLDSIMTQPTNISSILTDFVVSDPKTKEAYTYTWDAKKAGGSVILLKNDSSGRPVPEFTAAQKEVAKNALRERFRTMLDREIELKATPQAQLQERQQPTEGQIRRGDERRTQQAAAGAWNQLYTGKTAAEKQAAADILLGTPIAMEQGLMDIDLSKKGVISLKYENSAKNRNINYLDNSGKPISLFDFAGKGVELHGVVDRAQAVKAGGGGKTFGDIGDYKGIRSKREGKAAPTPPPPDVSALITPDLFTSKSEKSSVNLQSVLPTGFIVRDLGGTFGNDVEVIAPNGKKYKYNANMKSDKAEQSVPGLQQFIKLNNKDLVVDIQANLPNGFTVKRFADPMSGMIDIVAPNGTSRSYNKFEGVEGMKKDSALQDFISKNSTAGGAGELD